MEALEFIYQDTEIHFLLGNEKNVMVNATEMAKAFGKRIENFKRLDETKVFIKTLLDHENSKFAHSHMSEQNQKKVFESDIIETTNKATYYHRILALKFAAWLDPKFELWVYSKTEEVLFGNAKKVGQKITDSEKKKIDIAILIEKVKKIGNEDMNKLLLELDELKKIENEKKAAMRQFSNQYKMF